MWKPRKKSQRQQPVAAGSSQTCLKEQRSSVKEDLWPYSAGVHLFMHSCALSFWRKYHSVHSSSHPPRAAASARTLLVTLSLYEEAMMDLPKKKKKKKKLQNIVTCCHGQLHARILWIFVCTVNIYVAWDFQINPSWIEYVCNILWLRSKTLLVPLKSHTF